MLKSGQNHVKPGHSHTSKARARTMQTTENRGKKKTRSAVKNECENRCENFFGNEASQGECDNAACALAPAAWLQCALQRPGVTRSKNNQTWKTWKTSTKKIETSWFSSRSLLQPQNEERRIGV